MEAELARQSDLALVKGTGKGLAMVMVTASVIVSGMVSSELETGTELAMALEKRTPSSSGSPNYIDNPLAPLR